MTLGPLRRVGAPLGLSLLGLSLIVGSGCSESSRERGNSPDSWSDSRGLRVTQIREDLAVFPPFEGPPILGRASQLAVLDDQILVGESLDGRIHRFDFGGTWLGTFGSKGQGPGEFRSISEIQAAGDGTLWVGDPGNARWTRFDPEGAVREERSAHALATNFSVLPDGSFLVSVPGAPGSVARVNDPATIPSAAESMDAVRSLEDLAGLVASSATSLVLSEGDAWLLARDTVFRVPGIEADPPEFGVPVSGTPAFTLPEAWVAEQRAQSERAFGGRGFVRFLMGIGRWEGHGVVVVTTTPAGTLGYLLEAADAEAGGVRVVRLEAGSQGGLARGLRDLHLRGDTLFAITGTDVRMFRVNIP